MVAWRTIILLLLCASAGPLAAEPTREQLEEWFARDDIDHPEEAGVSDAGLRLLSQAPNGKVPVSRKHYVITADSLNDGWVRFDQCFHDLDAVPRAEVVYQYRRMRNLKVVDPVAIGRHWIEGQSIQLEDVGKDALLCIQAEVQILNRAGPQEFLLHSGPYQRRFLDGYFPMQVELSISYPAGLIRYSTISPQPAPGLKVLDESGELTVSALFSGQLHLDIRFKRKPE